VDAGFSFFGDEQTQEKSQAEETEADWSLAKEKKDLNAEGETADWSLAKEKPDLNAEGETADWSLAKEKPDLNAEGETADWSLAKEKPDLNAEGETADWSLAKEKGDLNATSGSADWSLAEQKEREKKLEQVSTEPTLSELKKSKTQRKKEREEDNDYDKEKYKRVRIRRFLNFSNVSCDVFLKIRKEKYIKIINAGEGYNEDQLERYQKKSVRYVFIPIEQHENFMHAFGDMVMDKLALVQKMGIEVKQAAELVIFDHIQNVASEYGISKKTASMVRGAIESNIATLKKMGGVMEAISKMMQGKNYISEHSLLLSYIAGQICNKTSWGNQNSIEKLSMAALFHDCCIEDDNLAQIHDQTNSIDKNWDKDDREMIEEHIGRAASMINAGESIFADVDTIVLQHHEKPDGSGYPRKLGSLSVSPLSAIFIIAEDFVSRIYGKSKNEVDIDPIKKEFEEKYNKGNYKKPLKAFLDAF
jgi:HD-GYP domain-containing protein (c-di-GMP phosphodiesterase class II)